MDSGNEVDQTENITFLISVADNAVRDAIKQAADRAHPVQLEALVEVLVRVEISKQMLVKDPNYFLDDDEDEDDDE